jgi:hypothetical protein
MNTRIKIILSLFFFCTGSIVPVVLHAQMVGGRYLLLKPSAVSNSMGGTGVAREYSPFASYFNPAALAFSPTLALSGSFGNPIPLFKDMWHSYLTGSVRIDGVGAIAASGNVYEKGKMATTSERSGDLIGFQNIIDWQAKVSFARVVSEDIAVGVSISMLRLKLSDNGVAQESGSGNSTTILFDAGIIYRNVLPDATIISEPDEDIGIFPTISDDQVPAGFSFGMALTNAGQRIGFMDASQSSPSPSTLTYGFAYSPVRTNQAGLMVTVDMENQLPEGGFVDYIHWGSEVTMLKIFALRGGYFKDTWGPENSFFTWGAGICIKHFQFNYARYTRALIPSWQIDGGFSWEL